MCRGTMRVGEGKAALIKQKDSPFQSTMRGQSACAGTHDGQAQSRFVHRMLGRVYMPEFCLMLCGIKLMCTLLSDGC